MAGLYLDPWQQFVIRHALGERPDGKWSAFEIGLMVSRQNGKGSILEALELYWLFLMESSNLIIHTAHEAATATEAFTRLVDLILDTPELDDRLPKTRSHGINRAHDGQGITLANGRRIRFRTRTSGGARGFSADLLIFDEAMKISTEMHASVMPTISARTMGNPGPQVWYTGSAVDEEVQGENGWVFSKVRERGLAEDPRLSWFEWSVDPARYFTDPQTAADPNSWAQANPGMGIRISSEYIGGTEFKGMPARKFAVERLGIGFWLNTDEAAGRLFTDEQWKTAADSSSKAGEPWVWAVDLTPERDRASIAKAGKRADGKWHVEVVENLPGTGWLIDRCAQIKREKSGSKFVIGSGSPAAALIQDFRNNRLRVVECSTQEYTRGCGAFYDAVVNDELRYLWPRQELDRAVEAAVKRPIGDAYAWDRKNLTDISPLVACTLALWAAQARKTVRFVSLAPD